MNTAKTLIGMVERGEPGKREIARDLFNKGMQRAQTPPQLRTTFEEMWQVKDAGEMEREALLSLITQGLLAKLDEESDGLRS